MRPLALVIVRVCWLIFIAVWMIAALSTKRSVYRQIRLQRLAYVLVLFVGAFLLFWGESPG